MITKKMEYWMHCGGNGACAIDNSPNLVKKISAVIRQANVVGAAMTPPLHFAEEIVDDDVAVKCIGGKYGDAVGHHRHDPIHGGDEGTVVGVKSLVFDMMTYQNRPLHEAGVMVPHDVAVRIKALLKTEPENEAECFGEDHVLSYTAKFDDGKEADVKLCGSQYDEENHSNTPWTEAVLFEDGCELCCTDVEDFYFGEWEIEYEDEVYRVHVTEEPNFIDVAPLRTIEAESAVLVAVVRDAGNLMRECRAPILDWFRDRCVVTGAFAAHAVTGESFLIKAYVTRSGCGDKIELYHYHDGDPVFTLKDLLQAVQPNIVYYWDLEDDDYHVVRSKIDACEPRYFIGAQNASFYIGENKIPYAHASAAVGICKICYKPVFRIGQNSGFGTCLQCGTDYRGADDVHCLSEER